MGKGRIGEEFIVDYIKDSDADTLENLIWDYFDPINRVDKVDRSEIEYIDMLIFKIQLLRKTMKERFESGK